jgi:hypothetical protein
MASLALLACIGCHSVLATTASDVRWLADLIQRLSDAPVASPPASIVEYDYRGQTVYYVPPRCCDIESDLYDRHGVLLCHPDGGLTGRGDGRCSDFLDTRRNERLIWTDPRGSR